MDVNCAALSQDVKRPKQQKHTNLPKSDKMCIIELKYNQCNFGHAK